MELTADTEQEAGIFAWCLNSDTLYGDTAVAALFGLDPEKTVAGLPVADYMDRVHAGDRAEVARLVSQAVIGGTPYRAEYRVLDADDTVRRVMAFGRCFRDRKGNPVQYAGIVHPIDEFS